MKTKFEFLEEKTLFRTYYIINVRGRWEELQGCIDWIKQTIGTEMNGSYLIEYLDNNNDQIKDGFYTRCGNVPILHIRFSNKENAMAFKLAFAE